MKTLKIAGGVYREICQFPERREILGSGGRAAAALSLLNKNVELHAFVADDRLREVRINLAAYEISLKNKPAKNLISFRWMHGLASPQQEPPTSALEQDLRMTVDGEVVLRYGMVEGDAVVNAETAIYDPQAPLKARSFHENGSRADRLAYVVNWSEAKLLTGSLDPYEQLTAIHRDEKADVVVLKLGPHGAIASNGRKTARIPCFKTNYVWPIGSGDVFSAVFSHFWAIEGLDCEIAAYRASIATAYYCSEAYLPLPESYMDEINPTPCRPTTRKGERRQIYLAGPFFTVSQRWLIDSLRDTFATLDVDIFSPIHDVGEGIDTDVAAGDLAGIEHSDVLFAVCDGLDAGTLFEVGYAVSRKIPVVAFAPLENDKDLTMLKGTGCTIERDLDTAIYKAVWAAMER